MSKSYVLIKVTPNDILFDLHPINNAALTRRIYLNNKVTKQALPREWALGVFQDDGIYNMYKQGLFTFDKNDEIVKDAFEEGVYFGEELDFTPAEPDTAEVILNILKTGNRTQIYEAIKKYGKGSVEEVAALNTNILTQGVITLLESILNIQLVLDQK